MGEQGHSSPLQSPTSEYGRLFEVIYWQAMQTSDTQLKNTLHSKMIDGTHMLFVFPEKGMNTN